MIPAAHWNYRPGWHLMTHSKNDKDVCRYFYPRTPK